MSRPALELADIIRTLGNDFIDRNRSWLTWLQLKVLLAIRRCRTEALGGHLDRCSQCGHQAISYNSCRNRHCPRCQTSARDRWLAERSKELLPVPYSHVVFTIPHQLAPLAYQNKRIIYDLLLRTSAATLLEVAADPRHLGAEIGFLSVLHTWGQNLHPSSPRSLCGSIRRAGFEQVFLDSSTHRILSAGQGTQQGISWEVCGRAEARIQFRQARFPW
jgi:hypothetical protein